MYKINELAISRKISLVVYLFVNILLHAGDKIVQAHSAQIAAVALTYRNGTGLGFLFADDQHEGNLLHLGFPDLLADLFIAIVQLGTIAKFKASRIFLPIFSLRSSSWVR